MGATPNHIAYTLRLLAAERESSQEVRERIDLVWTGQEVVGSESRDTSVVVRELFSTAKTSVLISSFAIDRGKKARELFGVLAERMDANSALQVRMFLNVLHRLILRKLLTSVILERVYCWLTPWQLERCDRNLKLWLPEISCSESLEFDNESF